MLPCDHQCCPAITSAAPSLPPQVYAEGGEGFDDGLYVCGWLKRGPSGKPHSRPCVAPADHCCRMLCNRSRKLQALTQDRIRCQLSPLPPHCTGYACLDLSTFTPGRSSSALIKLPPALTRSPPALQASSAQT